MLHFKAQSDESTISNSPTLDIALKCFTTNVTRHSLMNQLLDFNLFIDYHRPDVNALTETWLSNKIPDSLLRLTALQDLSM